ncbi:MAG: GNAT family N-acetyltransferase [Bacteroidetes bacterium]|nr:GNAT family N-acetyltransferase [Bacteroidota bacterium]
MNYIPHPTILQGKWVRLEPMRKDHFPFLATVAKDARIWEQLPTDGTNEVLLKEYIHEAVLKRAIGEQYPFTIFDHLKNIPIGSTRLFDFFPEHKKIEIGWTWLSPDYWGGCYNLECKLLLLTFCFETLLLNRVQLKTRDTNLRSQAAILKIGAKKEGILRKDRVMRNGEVRDTHLFSMIDTEWKETKEKLETLMKNFDN